MQKLKIAVILGAIICSLTACNNTNDVSSKKETESKITETGTEIEQAENKTSYIYSDDNITLCNYKGNKFQSEDPSGTPTEEEIEQQFFNIVNVGVTASGIEYDGTDEWVKSAFDNMYSIEEIYQNAENDAKYFKPQRVAAENKALAIQYVLDNSTVELTDEQIELAKTLTVQSYQNGVLDKGFESVDDYLQQSGFDETEEEFFEADSFLEKVKTDATYMVVINKVAELEDIIITDEEAEKYLTAFDSIKFRTNQEKLDAYFAGDIINVKNVLARERAEDIIYESSIFEIQEDDGGKE